jgi:glutamate racemase
VDDRPIGFFDSGMGGLTILAAARCLLPDERMLYLADSAHFPYSLLPVAALRRRAELVVEFLLQQRCKLITIACNTATVHTVAHLRAAFPDVPFVGVVPVVKMLAEQTRTRIIALMSTPATAESAYLTDLVARFAGGCRVINVACPGLADLIESAPAFSPAIAAHLETALAPVRRNGADVLGLGCTHFPLIRPQIRRALDPSVRIYDSALSVARRIRAVLADHDALSPARNGNVALFSTRDPDRLTGAALRLLTPLPAAAREIRLEGRSGVLVGTNGDPDAESCCYTTDRADSRGGAGLDAGADNSNTERCAR